MAEYEAVPTEYASMKIGQEVLISMTASDWLQLLGQFEMMQNNDLTSTMRKLGLAIWDTFTTEAYRKAAQAHIAQQQEEIPAPILKMMRMTGQLPDTDNDNPFDS